MANIALGKKTFSFDDLEKKYRNFFAPAFEVLIDGTNVVKESVAITKVTVNMTMSPKADSVSFNVVNAYDPVKREFQWLDQYFALGKFVEVKMGYTDKLESIFYGIITSVTLDYPSSGPPAVSVKGMDISFLMMKGKHSESWKEKKYSEVVSAIGQKYAKVEADATTEKLPLITQHESNDYQFMQWMAEQCHFEFFVLGKTIYFRKPLKDKTPVVVLSFGKNLRSFNTDMNLASQISQVIVRGYDPLKKEEIEAKSKQVDILGSNSTTGMDIMKTLGDFTTEYVYTNIPTVAEAQEKADAMMNRKAMELIHGSGESIGLPELQAGRFIKLDGVGKKMNQPMLLKSVTHTIDKSGYLTRFEVGGNAV